MEEVEPFGNSIPIKESILNEDQNKDKPTGHKINYCVVSIILILLFIVSIIAIMILLLKSDSDLSNYGQINCIYSINDTNNEIPIINPNYIKNQKFYILIDNNKIKYRTNYKFQTLGYHNITIILNELNIDMNNMFKDISSLISVEMSSDNNININNIENILEIAKIYYLLKLKDLILIQLNH